MHQPHTYSTPCGLLGVLWRPQHCNPGRFDTEYVAWSTSLRRIQRNPQKYGQGGETRWCRLWFSSGRQPQLSRGIIVGKLGTGYGWPSSHSQFVVRIPYLENSGVCGQVVAGLLLIVFNIAHLLSPSVRLNWVQTTRPINKISCICGHIRIGGSSVLFSVGLFYFSSLAPGWTFLTIKLSAGTI